MKKIYPRIRLLREERHLSQRGLSGLLNMNATQYARYERGDSVIPVEFMERLADYFNVSTDYILGRTDIKQ